MMKQLASTENFNRLDLINFLTLTAVWIGMIVLVNPLGNFPLNDDWAYAYSVKSLLETGKFQMSDWVATNLISQVYWGALFCLPFGFSFTALRFSTLILGWFGILITYQLLRELNTHPKLALIGSLVIALNPIYFSLSNTFMTDVPFFTFAILAFYFFVKGLQKDSFLLYLLGTAMSIVAILDRQIGLAIPLSFAVAYIMKKGWSFKNFIFCMYPTFIGVFIQLIYKQWLENVGELPTSYGNQIKTLAKSILEGVSVFNKIGEISFISLVYLGLFLLPFLGVVFARYFHYLSSIQKKFIGLAGFVLLSIILIHLTVHEKLMPLAGNILINFGIGPISIKNSQPPALPHYFLIPITALGLLGAGLIIFYLFLSGVKLLEKSQTITGERPWLITLILGTILIYFLPISPLGLSTFGFYDRYLIFLLPLFMMMVMTTNLIQWKIPTRSFAVVGVFLGLYFLFTVGATHDYLAWNRSRWQALNDLVQESKIAPQKIDGGMEFNGWYLFNPNYQYKPGKSWYWVEDDEYIVSFHPLGNYQVMKQYPFQRWFPPRQDQILILQRKSS